MANCDTGTKKKNKSMHKRAFLKSRKTNAGCEKKELLLNLQNIKNTTFSNFVNLHIRPQASVCQDQQKSDTTPSHHPCTPPKAMALFLSHGFFQENWRGGLPPLTSWLFLDSRCPDPGSSLWFQQASLTPSGDSTSFPLNTPFCTASWAVSADSLN